MTWLPVLVTGGVLYASGKVLQRVKKPAWFARQPAATDVQQADRELVVSAASLSVAAVGGLPAAIPPPTALMGMSSRSVKQEPTKGKSASL